MDWMIPCHCTGDNAMQQMQDYLGKDIVSFGHTGIVIDLGEMPRNTTGVPYEMCNGGHHHGHGGCGCGGGCGCA